MADRVPAYIVFKTYKDVKDHFLGNKVYRIDCEDAPLNFRYKDCHVFMAYNLATGEEANIPRAVLPKDNCTEEDEYEIQQVGYLGYDETEPFSEPDDPYPLNTEAPEPGDPYPFDAEGPAKDDAIN